MLDLLENKENTLSPLPTSIILLNQANSLLDINIESEWILDHLYLWLVALVVLDHEVVNQGLLVEQRHGRYLLLFVVVSLLLLFLLLLLGLLLFLSALLLNWLLEDQIQLNAVIFSEIPRHWNLDHRGIVLQVKQQLVQVDVDGLLPGVELCDFILKLTNSANSALEHLLNEDALLRVDILIVALLELAIDIDVLNVEHGQVLEDLVLRPVRENWLALLVFLVGLVLILHLLLQLVYRILQLQVIRTESDTPPTVSNSEHNLPNNVNMQSYGC